MKPQGPVTLSEANDAMRVVNAFLKGQQISGRSVSVAACQHAQRIVNRYVRARDAAVKAKRPASNQRIS
jgi:hypothetical protein